MYSTYQESSAGKRPNGAYKPHESTCRAPPIPLLCTQYFTIRQMPPAPVPRSLSRLARPAAPFLCALLLLHQPPCRHSPPPPLAPLHLRHHLNLFINQHPSPPLSPSTNPFPPPLQCRTSRGRRASLKCASSRWYYSSPSFWVFSRQIWAAGPCHVSRVSPLEISAIGKCQTRASSPSICRRRANRVSSSTPHQALVSPPCTVRSHASCQDNRSRCVARRRDARRC